MKYPQLVSNRAVNEISDWLIKRLEDLEIEQPNVYTRFLLSLLHTPFKVNVIDLLELPHLKDLKQPYQLLHKNNEELKRLAVVEILMEASTEENKSNIVTLVDELHLKLRKIESTSNLEEARSSANISSPASSKVHKNLKKIKRNHGAENPTKNYYLAFPALSGQNKKSASSGSKLTSPGSCAIDTNETMKKDADLMLWSSLMSKSKEHQHSPAIGRDAGNLMGAEKIKTPTKRRYGKNTKRYYKTDNVQFNTTVAKQYESYDGSPKKMQVVKNGQKKRQRNQYATSKNPKNCANTFNAPKMEYQHQRHSQQQSGTAAQPWDMDFKGQWEMDRDLVGEFIEKQKNDKNRPAKKSFTPDEEDDTMLMKCLPQKLIDETLADDQYENNVSAAAAIGGMKAMNIKEAQSINSFKLKFDENIKALWGDVDDGADPQPSLLMPLTYKMRGEDNASLASSFPVEKNPSSLFNFDGQRHLMEVNVPAATTNEHQYYGGGGNVNSTNFAKILDYDCNNNNNIQNGNWGAIYSNQHNQYQSAVSPATEKFIKSGTNLQTSIWSNSSEFANEPESLIYKDAVDHGTVANDDNDGIYKKMNSIGAELKYWQNTNASVADDESDSSEMTLFNHSDVSSFKRFRPLMTSTIIRANYHPLNNPLPTERCPTIVDTTDSSENLLTSEATHFSPIIRDGHTFPIDSNWDEIKWERSASGGLIYNEKRYMKWNSDAKKPVNYNEIDLDAMEDEAANFCIKFMVVDNDKACQTDPNDFLMSQNQAMLEINEEYCKRKIYDEYFKGLVDHQKKWRNFEQQQLDKQRHLENQQENYSFFSVNRVKNAVGENAAKTLQNILMSSNSSSSSICTITSSYEASSTVDPFESWRSLKIDNCGMIDSDYKQPACLHSLWEQCGTCTRNGDPYEEKSIPANRLMKDELRMDGDEIMNVIQNLYITGDYRDSEEEKEEDEEFDMNHVYMDMVDESMDGSAEEESKFYDPDSTKVDTKANQKTYTPNMFERQQREELLQLENFDDITLTKVDWQWDKNAYKMDKDPENYLKLLNMIHKSLSKGNYHDNNNNDSKCYQLSNGNSRPKNRKRRHSTCQNFMDNFRTNGSDVFFSFNANLSQSPPGYIEDNANLLMDAAKMFKVNIEKILLITNPLNGNRELETYKDGDGVNYYRNILQQQHALIKHMDLARPLTR